MSMSWPWALLGLLALPVLLLLYLRRQRRRRPAVAYPSLALIRAAAPARSTWKRHVPFALVLAALAALTVAGARPQVRTGVPVSSSAIILALDVSGSMCATDVDPNRLAAAQEAVRRFVERQDDTTRIGLVIFAGSAQLAVAPTLERDTVTKVIDGLTVGRGTAIGAAILKAVDAIGQVNPDVAAAAPGPSLGGAPGPGLGGGGTDPAPSAPPSGPGTSGDHVPEIVVLLTDGANTRGVTPIAAAEDAAARGVRVYPIGFGTKNPTALVCTSTQLGGDLLENPGRRFGPGGGPPRNFLVADEDTLRQVAITTGGEYFAATDADQLQQVFDDLPTRVDVVQQDVEVTAVLAGLGALLMLLAFGAAARWSTFPT
jgi:Ca-activated chloride channel family protein